MWEVALIACIAALSVAEMGDAAALQSTEWPHGTPTCVAKGTESVTLAWDSVPEATLCVSAHTASHIHTDCLHGCECRVLIHVPMHALATTNRTDETI
jgi:hypothetical protein